MSNRSWSWFAGAVLAVFCGSPLQAEVAATDHGAGTVSWLRSDATAFAQAHDQHRFVLLYLEAVWCHWCHVMDEQTYSNAGVEQEIAAHYVPLRIDQDLRPDLSNRYQDYGWPATVVFAADGTEIVKRQGFVEPERFLKLLKAIVADPSPEAVENADSTAKAPRASALDADTRAALIKRHVETFDADLGGLKTGQKYLERDSVEYAIARGLTGDKAETAMARKTMDAARALFDPAWGGVYQYSTYGDWKHPHYEKLAAIQAQYLRIYALAYAAFGQSQDQQAVLELRRYLDAFLKSPEGGYYVSQDADLRPGEHSTGYFALGDKQRRAQGVPRVDKHLYALQNGQIVEALATWAELTEDNTALLQAQATAQWAIEHRALDGGGFRHDENDAAGPYLGDTLAMGRAFLALYRATADRVWLARAGAAADFIAQNFARAQGGYLSAKTSGPIAAMPQVDETIALERFANLLARYSGKAEHRAMAESAMRYLADPKVALDRLTEAGVLLADDELHADPLHLTVMGAKSDPAAKILFAIVQRLPQWYKRVEWWDKAEGPLPNPDVSYPSPKRAAAFVCTENRCSLPIFEPDQIAVFLQNSSTSHSE